MTDQFFKIAPGNNNVAGEKVLNQLSPPLLSDFGRLEGVLTEYHDFISLEFDGDRKWVSVGLPWVKVSLYRVSRADFAYLKTLEGLVTIHVLNQSLNLYQDFNATLKTIETNSSDAKWAADGLGGFQDVALTFYDLQVVS